MLEGGYVLILDRILGLVRRFRVGRGESLAVDEMGEKTAETER